MKRFILTISTLGMALQPGMALAIGLEDFDFSAMAFYMIINLVATAGMFAVGIILLGLAYDRFRPWIDVSEKQRPDHQEHLSRKPHLNPQRNVDEETQEQQQDAC